MRVFPWHSETNHPKVNEYAFSRFVRRRASWD